MIRKVINVTGMAVRETGQALHHLGERMQETFRYTAPYSRHRQLMAIVGKRPWVSNDAFVAPSASIIGDVRVGAQATVWYNAVLRGDQSSIMVGVFSSIGDRAVITAGKHASGAPAHVQIGNHVNIGPGAVLHACKVDDRATIGAGAVVMEGAVVEEDAVVLPGTVVPPGRLIPKRQVWQGNPAKFVREVTDDEVSHSVVSAEETARLAGQHSEEFLPHGTAYLDAENIVAERHRE